MLLPDKSNRIDAADGKFRLCPHCSGLLGLYQTTKKSKEVSRTLSGYICQECGLICLNRKALNEVVELFGRT
jgi:hypothetical protein